LTADFSPDRGNADAAIHLQCQLLTSSGTSSRTSLSSSSLSTIDTILSALPLASGRVPYAM
jgi:hypothetical protein